MLRFLLFLTLAACPLLADSDPEFQKFPFDTWLKHEGETRIKWTAHVYRPQLSAHQRLMTQVEALVDGAEFAKRIGKGQFLFFVQITDADGRLFQNHTSVDLEKMQDGIRKQDVSCLMSAFVLPGEYKVALALFDTATGEHSARQEQLRVDPVKRDPLDGMWKDLPPVEFIAAEESPDAWYLPKETGRLHLPLKSNRKVHLELVVNLTPSERLTGSNRAQERNLGRLIPSLKTMLQVDLANGSTDVELLDLARQRVAFHQKSVDKLNWAAMRDKLTDTKAGVIDLKSLENRGQSADFFAQHIAKKVEKPDADARRVVVVLSSPVQFESREHVEPISITRAPECSIYYIRYRGVQTARFAMMRNPADPNVGIGRRGPPPLMGPGIAVPAPRAQQIDQLAQTIKPLSPRLFDVATPEEFRKALADILNDISRMD